MTYHWRFLLVEDKNDIAQQIQEAVPTFIDAPDTVVVERKSSFQEGLKRLNETRFDVLILDLKDDQNTDLDVPDDLAGLNIFEALKTIRFAPVIFYTAHAQKVRHLESPFVRVVEKTQGLEKLQVEIKNVIATGLPHLSQHIEDIQREYMWDFVSTHWTKFDMPQHKTDIAYLLTRRLAAKLELKAALFAQQLTDENTAQTITGSDVHPMQIYLYPKIDQLQGGDILSGKVGEVDANWIVLSPTCDLVQNKAEKVLLARCIPLSETIEHSTWIKQPGTKTEKALMDLIGDNRKDSDKSHGKRIQPERYKYLPGTFFITDSVVDFQDIVTISIELIADESKFKRVACLASPFAEALLGKFTRYFSRLGTPDISKAAVLGRLDTARKSLHTLPMAEVQSSQVASKEGNTVHIGTASTPSPNG
jgi:CheY-like chemotaxis protein